MPLNHYSLQSIVIISALYKYENEGVVLGDFWGPSGIRIQKLGEPEIGNVFVNDQMMLEDNLFILKDGSYFINLACYQLNANML